MTRRKVLLTGAAGTISSQLLPALRERYDLVCLDVTKDAGHGVIDDVVIADLANPDIDAYREHFAGVDAVIHNGFTWSPGRDSGAPLQWLPDDERRPGTPDGYYTERTNVDMVFHVLKLALEENIRRVVVTSSNHAADWYETKLHHGAMDMVGPDSYPASDNFYGWAKVAYEQLGFVFATGRFGCPVENIHIRIGAPRPIRWRDIDDNPVSFRRDLGAYISSRDLCQLYIKSIETEDIRDDGGVPHQRFYGISNNTRAFWSIANARRIIGYAPEDDSEILFAEDRLAHIADLGGRTMGECATP
jgi:nucleoside-diphosphate-sugar epimerase